MRQHWIDNPQALAQALRDAPPVVGMDTEFVRERTYWPRLALVQLALGDAAGDAPILLVDAAVDGMPAALAPLLADAAITKVMHSASEDIVALHHACGVAPTPLFDTQIAAALAGVGSGIGYQKLVETLCDVRLDKGQTRSDWLRRPLSPEQLAYAADDVRHLHRLHHALDARLRDAGREAWAREDAERLVQAGIAQDGERWPHLGMRSAQFLDADGQRRLVRLLRWRDAHARERDLPRSWVLDNELLHALARKPPEDAAALRTQLAQTPRAPRQLAAAIWTALDTPLPGEDDMPLARDDAPDRARLKAMQAAVAQAAGQAGIPEGVLASRRWLQALLEDGRWPAPLAGWRRQLLEPVLTPLLDDRGPPSV